MHCKVLLLSLLVLVVVAVQSYTIIKTEGSGLRSISRLRLSRFSRLHAKLAKANEGEVNNENEGGSELQSNRMVDVPPDGLIGYEPGSLFRKPIDVYNPFEDTDDLPGEDGSDEKITGIENRIQERIAAMKESGEWDEAMSSEFGKDPLRDVPLWKAMIENAKVAQPFDSWGELVVVVGSVTGTIVLLTGFLVFSSEVINAGLKWFTDADFVVRLPL